MPTPPLPDLPPTPPGRTLGDHLIRVVKLISASKALIPWPHPDVDPFHFPLLFRVWAEPQRLSDLAQALGADLSTTSRQVSHLTSLGLLQKVPDPRDGRAQLIDITPAGKDLVLLLREQRSAYLGQVLDDWSPADRETFTRLLARFTDDLDAAVRQLREERASGLTPTDPSTDPARDPSIRSTE
ncbi:MarR family winged helix-turn-helix transcriptional regulator [Aestuariimicrobium soli]|uniref:MarR family winged helix-turn-helix transcriptional regulator n=1 Tax=Aestuariimicrobium soli TaxID=2035834 RepID=UPI003EC0D419